MNETVFLSSCYLASGFNFLARPSLEKCDKKKNYVCSAGYLLTVIQYCHVHW